jgi:phosphatidylglycerophosphate synthase
LPSWDDYADRWSALHGGYDPRRASPLVRGWLRLAYELSRYLPVSPDAVTLLGLLLSAGVPATVLSWPLASAGLVALSALADTVDGALAVATGRVSRLGQVYDAVADRLAEACWLVALTLVGVPAWLTVCCGALAWLHEYVRARATAAGMAGIGVVTVAERPTRVLLAAAALAAAFDGRYATVATAVWAALGAVALVQLLVTVRRSLRSTEPA